MAKTKRKKSYLVRFELGLGGIFSLGIVCFCIFLWLFLLGVWAGQTILLPAGEQTAFSPLARFTGAMPGKNDRAEKEKQPEETFQEGTTTGRTGSGLPEEDSFFSLQVAAFRDPDRADKAVRNWKARGYDAFTQPVAESDESDDGFTRVFVGRFAQLADANALAAKLEKKEGIKAYIALLPVSEIQLP